MLVLLWEEFAILQLLELRLLQFFNVFVGIDYVPLHLFSIIVNDLNHIIPIGLLPFPLDPT